MYRIMKTYRMPYLAGHFGKRATNYRALLWKITCKDKASYGSSPLCNDSFKYLFHMCCIFLDSFFAKGPLIIGLFCGKSPIKIRHPMGLRHPVTTRLDASYICVAFFFINFSTTCTVIKSACFL